ncbi:MAG: hypothetical protein AB1295_00750 [Candidatus Micrarchaeota archaeon]
MATEEAGRFEIPEVRGAVSIEGTVARLRGYIGSECSSLLRRTSGVAAGRVSAERTTLWKSKINRILEVKDSTFGIDELEGLLRKCRDISDELERSGH